MNLGTTIIIYAGGPGSGCTGSNCGRPTLYHLTNEKNLKSILKNGLKTHKTGAKNWNRGWDRTGNAVYAIENKDHAPDIKWTLENELNPNNTPGSLGKKQVLIAFQPEGRVRIDPEYEDYDTEDGAPFSARIHSGPIPAKGIIGYYKTDKEGKPVGKLKVK